MVGKAEMLGFSRVLRCWCVDGMIFKFYVREYIEKFNNISIILKKCILNDKIVVNIWEDEIKNFSAYI